jgi:DNA repair exonuclease SbcCD ATPase subunit
MKQLSYIITAALAIIGMLLVQNVVSAFAQDVGGKHLINEVNHFQNQASSAANKNQDNLQGIIQKADSLIANRLSSLNELLTRLQNDKRLSANEKSSLTSDIQNEISGLTSLKTKIDADTDVTTARTDAKQIITNYYVYVVFDPKVRLLITINNLQTVTANVQALVPQLQSLINTLKSQGQDVTQLQALLDDISSQLQTINTTLTNDATTVEGVSVSSESTAHTTFVKIHQDLSQIVKTDFGKIRSDFEQMRTLFKQIISPGKDKNASSSGNITTTCKPRPACLDTTPRCMIMEPANGWCPNTPTPSDTATSPSPSQ